MSRSNSELMGSRPLKVEAYVRHRLKIAGAGDVDPFDKQALALMHVASGGIPRLINRLGNAAMLAAYGAGQTHIDRSMVADVVSVHGGSHGLAGNELDATASVEPTDAPRAIVYSTSGIVESRLIPVLDSRNVTGRFWLCIPLDSKYSAGYYWVQYLYVVSGTTKSEIEAFSIRAGGNIRGTGISMEHFRRPPNDYILLQTDGGVLLRKKNPEVAT